MIANVLTIAGTDPSGGAGISADLKTFSALGTYGMAAITAVVAQNTQGVRSFRTLEPAFVAEQIDAVFDDVEVAAVKIGMVATAAIAEAIADTLEKHPAQAGRDRRHPRQAGTDGDHHHAEFARSGRPARYGCTRYTGRHAGDVAGTACTRRTMDHAQRRQPA